MHGRLLKLYLQPECVPCTQTVYPTKNVIFTQIFIRHLKLVMPKAKSVYLLPSFLHLSKWLPPIHLLRVIILIPLLFLYPTSIPLSNPPGSIFKIYLPFNHFSPVLLLLSQVKPYILPPVLFNNLLTDLPTCTLALSFYSAYSSQSELT